MVEVVGTDVLGEDASSANATVAPLDMTSAMVAIANVFFAKCFIVAPFGVDFVIRHLKQ